MGRGSFGEFEGLQKGVDGLLGVPKAPQSGLDGLFVGVPMASTGVVEVLLRGVECPLGMSRGPQKGSRAPSWGRWPFGWVRGLPEGDR